MKPLVSIIIPTYNRGHLIGETLESILSQTYKSWECIVVDDGSTDNTEDLLKDFMSKDNRIQYHKRPVEILKGPNACRNFGYQISKGEYIKWFDSDDLMYDDLLEKHFFSINNNFDCSVCKIVHSDLETNVLLGENNIIPNNLVEDYLVGNITFYVSGPLWKRTFLEQQKKMFDEKISNLDDWDFNLRMLYQEPKINYVNEVLISYRIHNDSLSREIVKCNFEEIISEFKARRKHLLILIWKKKIQTVAFKEFIISRNKFYLREALLQKSKYDFYLFKNLLFTQILLFDINGMFKSFAGYFGLKFFNKGYNLFK
ncbi:glycosyltransferase [Flavobacterium sp. LHD-85]|uniref:glycosyltransferase family 2 protein n=1 Tax=Flavobacterium sp. LHD-85 TaxID=3071410 RepID=UPI0027DEC9F1|nr:glycosyltransferase [Flavobacterium sp. LHD-85]MDQ6529618.1 glycosyltransferase [Flavobacterium sp. LHD-85]